MSCISSSDDLAELEKANTRQLFVSRKKEINDLSIASRPVLSVWEKMVNFGWVRVRVRVEAFLEPVSLFGLMKH